MSILDVNADQKALQAVVSSAVTQAIAGLAKQVAPAVGAALQEALDGLTVTVTIGKKGVAA